VRLHPAISTPPCLLICDVTDIRGLKNELLLFSFQSFILVHSVHLGCSIHTLPLFHFDRENLEMGGLSNEALDLHGGCDCKAIRHQITIPPLEERTILFPAAENKGEGDLRPPETYFDHCNKCRTVSGAIVQCWLNCPRTWVDWTLSSTAEPSKNGVSTKDFLENSPPTFTLYKSSPEVSRYFCGHCGTNLVYVYEGERKESAMIDIVMGSLDKESLETEGLRPDRHFYWDHGVSWVKSIVEGGDSAFDGQKMPRHPEGSREHSV
jgi:hypothetical protein